MFNVNRSQTTTTTEADPTEKAPENEAVEQNEAEPPLKEQGP